VTFRCTTNQKNMADHLHSYDQAKLAHTGASSNLKERDDVQTHLCKFNHA